MEELILIYNIKDSDRLEKVRKALQPLKIKIKTVDKKDYKLPILRLLTGKPAVEKEKYEGDELLDEMLVMSVQPQQIDKILASFKTEGIYFPYKAVVTAKNSLWDSLKLFNELQREHEAMKRI